MSNGKDDLVKRLMSLKEKRDKAKSLKDQLDGRLKGEYDRLKKNYDCANTVQAKKILDGYIKRKDAAIEELEIGIEKLEGKVKDNYEEE